MERARGWDEQRKELAISVNRLAALVGIKQPSMRLILLGVNKPKIDTQERLERILGTIPRCDRCHRAFLPEDDDDSDSAFKTAKTAKGGR